MRNCKCECAYLSIIIGIIAGVIIGVLYSMGFVPTTITLLAYLAIGVLGVLLSPIYASNTICPGNESCFCSFRRTILIAAAGSIITAAAGLIVAGVASIIITAIVIAIATFFTAMLIVSVICLARCLCDR